MVEPGDSRPNTLGSIPRHVLENLLEGCQVIGFDFRYLFVNGTVAQHGRTTQDRLIGRTMQEAFPGIEQTPMFAVLRQCLADRTYQQLENEFLFPDGTKGWFELRFVPVPEGVAILSQEITERKRSEEKLRHLNAVLHGIRNVNQLITRERDPKALIQKACDLLVESRGYLMSCIVLLDGHEVTESVFAWAPSKKSALRSMLAKGELPACMIRALETEEIVVVVNPDLACLECPVNRNLTEARDALICRLSIDGRTLGMLLVSVPRGMGQVDEEADLLSEVARDVAFALRSIEIEGDHRTIAMAAQTSDQRYRSLFDNASFGIAYCRMLYENERPVDFVYLEVNAAFEDLTGLHDVTGRRVSEVIPGIQESDPELFEVFGRVTRISASERFELSLAALHQWFDVSVYCPQPDHFVAVFDVITKRKLAEESLARFNSRLERLAAVVQDLSCVRRLGDIQDIVRHAARDLAGSDGATFVLRDGDLCHYVDEDAISPLWKGKRFPISQCISGWVMCHRVPAVIEDIYQDDRIPKDAYRPTFVRSLAMVPIRSVTPIGAIGTYWATPHRIADEDLRILQALANAASVALENVRAIGELERSEHRYRELVDNLDDVVFSLDTEGRFRYVSPAAVKFGYTPEEFLNLHFSQFVHPEDLPRAVDSFTNTLAGRVDPIEIRAFDKQGKLRTLRSSGRVVVEEGRPIGTAGVLTDVTDQRNTEEQLRASQRLESVGRLAGGVAHDFNNMLSVIISYTEFAIAALKEDDTIRQDLEEVLRSGRRAAALTHQLLAFSRKQVLKPEVISLNQVIKDMGGMLRRLLGEDIILEINPQEELCNTKADPSQIEQVIMNLAINSRDAMLKGGRLTIETADVELDENYASQHVAVMPGPYVMMAVTDTGVGMDAKTRERLFEPFFTTKEQGKGTGLGLATVYGIVKQSGGNIWVYSEPGRGTTFKVYLPRVLSSEETTVRVARIETRPRGTETILLVEDEEAVRNLAKRILSTAGYSVICAANGGEALLACEQHEGDIPLLVTDVIMPKMSGRELADRLAKLRPGIKVLYMSGYTDNSIVHHGVLDEGTNFLAKPINALVLTRKVREVLDS